MHGGYLSEYRIKADRVAVKINPVQSTRNLPAIFKIRNIIVGFNSPLENNVRCSTKLDFDQMLKQPDNTFDIN